MNNLQRVQEKVSKSKLSLPKIVNDTGLGYGWLKGVMANKFKEPNPDKMGLLEGYLDHYEKMNDYCSAMNEEYLRRAK